LWGSGEEMLKHLVIFISAFCLSACSTFYPGHIERQNSVLLNGAGPDVDVASVQGYAASQDRYLAYFANLAGLMAFKGTVITDKSGIPVEMDLASYDLTNVRPAEWKDVTNAGINYINTQCEQYLHAIWELNRAKLATSSEINLLGSLTSAVLGAASASAPAIAITASAFGFAASTSDNLYSSLLYQLEPSGVNALVHKSENAVKANIAAAETANQIASRNDTVGALQQYIAVCTPQNIEAGVNEAVKTAGVSVSAPSGTTSNQTTGGTAGGGGLPPAGGASIGALGASGVQINAAPAAPPAIVKPAVPPPTKPTS
jgi:hypothetical protein